MQAMYEGINVTYPDDMDFEEARQYAQQEMEIWKRRMKKIASLTIDLIDDEVEIKATEKSPIKRLARITGYLSNTENFNDAKRQELKERYKHC